MNRLVFQKVPEVEFGSNKFINCPIIFQFDDTPLIELIKLEQAGFSTQIPIYHEDGTYLAKVVGSQLFPTDEGKRAGINLHHYDKLTVCELKNRTLFEIRREGPAALKTTAELFTPSGYFVKYTDNQSSLFNASGDSLNIRGMVIRSSTFIDCRIGVWVKSDGSINLGCG